MERYPLTGLGTRFSAIAPPTPLVIGVNWYSAFDTPVRKDNAWWIGLDANRLGRVRGGHCVCVRPAGVDDTDSWWTWYDQVSEGICVSEGVSRAVALATRVRCQPRPLYDEAQLVDEWDDTPPGEGTSVDAGLRVALRVGLVRAKRGERHWIDRSQVTRPPDFRPLTAFHWITEGMDEVRDVLSLRGDREWVSVCNSWGRDGYPHYVRLPLETLDRLRREDGELGVPIFADRV